MRCGTSRRANCSRFTPAGSERGSLMHCVRFRSCSVVDVARGISAAPGGALVLTCAARRGRRNSAPVLTRQARDYFGLLILIRTLNKQSCELNFGISSKNVQEANHRR
jgi:hypothetical protein